MAVGYQTNNYSRMGQGQPQRGKNGKRPAKSPQYGNSWTQNIIGDANQLPIEPPARGVTSVNSYVPSYVPSQERNVDDGDVSNSNNTIPFTPTVTPVQQQVAQTPQTIPQVPSFLTTVTGNTGKGQPFYSSIPVDSSEVGQRPDPKLTRAVNRANQPGGAGGAQLFTWSTGEKSFSPEPRKFVGTPDLNNPSYLAWLNEINKIKQSDAAQWKIENERRRESEDWGRDLTFSVMAGLGTAGFASGIGFAPSGINTATGVTTAVDGTTLGTGLATGGGPQVAGGVATGVPTATSVPTASKGIPWGKIGKIGQSAWGVLQSLPKNTQQETQQTQEQDLGISNLLPTQTTPTVTTPTSSTATPTTTFSGQGTGWRGLDLTPVTNPGVNPFAGFNLDRAFKGGDPNSTKDAFARWAAGIKGNLNGLDMNGVEALIKSDLDRARQMGLNILDVKGDKILIDTKEHGPMWIDVVQNAGGANSAWAWQLQGNPTGTGIARTSPGNLIYQNAQNQLLNNKNDEEDELTKLIKLLLNQNG